MFRLETRWKDNEKHQNKIERSSAAVSITMRYFMMRSKSTEIKHVKHMNAYFYLYKVYCIQIVQTSRHVLVIWCQRKRSNSTMVRRKRNKWILFLPHICITTNRCQNVWQSKQTKGSSKTNHNQQANKYRIFGTNSRLNVSQRQNPMEFPMHMFIIKEK